MKTRLAIAFALALATAVSLWVWWTRDVHHTPRIFNGPMVQMVTTEGFTLTWQLDPDIQAQVTVLDNQNAELSSITPVRIKDPVTCAQTRWSASVRGLQPGVAYRYRITAKLPSASETIVSEDSVRTAVQPGQPFRFIALGDTGTGKSAQYRIARLLPAWTPDLVLHAGDIITPKAYRYDIPAKFFRPYTGLLSRTPMYACLGNHDCRVEQGRPMLDTFVLPDNGPAGEESGRHYWFDWGDARFIVVDSNHDFPYFRDTVAPWLDRVLADADRRWTIVVWHEPVITNGSQYPPAQKLLLSLVPIMDKHRCTLAFSGHQHLYERSWPIHEGQVVTPEKGTIYITSGAGGSNLYEELTPQSPLIAAYCDTQHSFTVVDVTTDRLAIRQIGDTGALLDEHLIERPGQ